MKRAMMLVILLVGCVANAQLVPTNPPANVVLAWDAPSGDVAGYNVYWGCASRSYTNVVSTTGLMATITNLQRGVTYYFAATAFTAAGLESEFSNQVSYTPLARPVAPVLRLGFADGWELRGEGEPYQMYCLQRTTDLAAWATLAIVTADGSGAFVARDVRPPVVAAFYRATL